MRKLLLLLSAIPLALGVLHREALAFEFEDARRAVDESFTFGPERRITCIRAAPRKTPFRSALSALDEVVLEWRIAHPKRVK
jgi:hypothetical protein